MFRCIFKAASFFCAAVCLFSALNAANAAAASSAFPPAAMNFAANSDLLRAASQGDIKALKATFAAGADLNASSEIGDHAINLAAAGGHVSCCEFLLDNGAAVDALGADSRTALMTAAEADNPSLVSLLLLYKASVVKQSPLGETAMILAAKNGDFKCVRPLFFAGSDVNAKDALGGFALEYAAKSAAWSSSAVNSLQLLLRDANPVAADNQGQTALMMAAYAHSLSAVSLLLSRRASPSARDAEGRTALVYAIQGKAGSLLYSSKNTVKPSNKTNAKIKKEERELVNILLLSSSQSHDELNSDLALAAVSGNDDAAKALIDSGADVNNLVNADSFLQMQLDAKSNDASILKGFPKRLTPLMAAASLGQDGIVKLLLASHCNAAARDDFGLTAIMYASRYGALAAVKALIDHGVDVDAADKSGRRAIMHAASLGAYGVWREAAKNDFGISARSAAEKTDKAIIELLAHSGADLNAKDLSGKNAAKIAEESGNMNALAVIRSLSAP
jgi:ankyrin repeat protein